MGVHNDIQAELGPRLKPAGEMRAIAREAHQLVLILLDMTAPGGDPLRAARTLDKLRAVVGPSPGRDVDG